MIWHRLFFSVSYERKKCGQHSVNMNRGSFELTWVLRFHKRLRYAHRWSFLSLVHSWRLRTGSLALALQLLQCGDVRQRSSCGTSGCSSWCYVPTRWDQSPMVIWCARASSRYQCRLTLHQHSQHWCLQRLRDWFRPSC